MLPLEQHRYHGLQDMHRVAPSHFDQEDSCGCMALMWKLLDCFRGHEYEASRSRVVIAEARASQYQAPSIPSPPHLGSVSSHDEDDLDNHERGLLLRNKRTLPEPQQQEMQAPSSALLHQQQQQQQQGSSPQGGGSSGAAAPDHPRHRRTASGASTRSRGGSMQDGAGHRRAGSGGGSSKLPSYSTSGKGLAGSGGSRQDLGAVARGTAGLLMADDDIDADCCPTCLEAYTDDNPKIWTRCGHGFHMQCIYEWLERKDTCPMCESHMDFEEDVLI